MLSESGGVMNERPDPYTVLGVTPSATPAQISHAFRTKVRALHPDTGPARSQLPDDADAQLQRLLLAYSAGAPGVDARGPVTVRITDRRTPARRPRKDLWAGPVRRHR